MHLPLIRNLFTLPADIESLSWEAHDSNGRVGARIHRLFHCAETGQQVALVHCAPGTHAQAHRHHGHESILVLDGSFEDQFGSHGKGELIMYPPGSQHGWTSPNGGLMYVVWGARVSLEAA